MDEIDALNEEWNRIRSRGLSTGGAGVTGYNSNSSDTNSGSKPRRKRSRWSNDAAAEEIKAPSNGSKPVTSAAQINFGDSVSKLVAERRDWEKTQIAAGVSKNQVVDRIAEKRETVAKQQLSQEPRRFPFGGHDEDELVTTEVSSSSSKQTRKYRHRNSSTSSESEAESQKNDAGLSHIVSLDTRPLATEIAIGRPPGLGISERSGEFDTRQYALHRA
ncbi:unnamed protein product [Nesidiocoris tenuis]|uniref:Uncharacterized protein n=1 Tax=Nesidiocoris tenuis TaxID=355587 RepID=A0A6H5HA64_9HEMI|nr:unnamed protein product [Nesidiocoris tenuis]